MLNGTNILVDLEGEGNCIMILEGIDVAADGDTVLVLPGRYYENIDFSGKTIIVESRLLMTGNNYFISHTIIDSNQTGTCFLVNSGEGEVTLLCEFTLCNGSGIYEVNGGYGSL